MNSSGILPHRCCLFDRVVSSVVHMHVAMLYSSHTAKATFAAITNTYTYLTPDLWSDMKLTKPPFQEHTDFLSQTQKQPAAMPRPVE